MLTEYFGLDMKARNFLNQFMFNGLKITNNAKSVEAVGDGFLLFVSEDYYYVSGPFARKAIKYLKLFNYESLNDALKDYYKLFSFDAECNYQDYQDYMTKNIAP